MNERAAFLKKNGKLIVLLTIGSLFLPFILDLLCIALLCIHVTTQIPAMNLLIAFVGLIQHISTWIAQNSLAILIVCSVTLAISLRFAPPVTKRESVLLIPAAPFALGLIDWSVALATSLFAGEAAFGSLYHSIWLSALIFPIQLGLAAVSLWIYRRNWPFSLSSTLTLLLFSWSVTMWIVNNSVM